MPERSKPHVHSATGMPLDTIYTNGTTLQISRNNAPPSSPVQRHGLPHQQTRHWQVKSWEQQLGAAKCSTFCTCKVMPQGPGAGPQSGWYSRYSACAVDRLLASLLHVYAPYSRTNASCRLGLQYRWCR